MSTSLDSLALQNGSGMHTNITPALFSPIRLRQLELRNRIIVSPMCQYSANNGCANDWHLMHVGNLSQSGAGMIIMEMTSISPEGRISPNCLGLWQDEQIAPLRRVVEFCKLNSDITMGLQIAHAGRKGSVSPPWTGGLALAPDQGGWQTTAPSPIAFSDRQPTPHELSKTEIEDLIEAFGNAAKRAEQCGFDAIELHAAHGYLAHQFLSPLSNKREDDYGGSLTNRMRFTLNAFRVMRANWPDHKPLGVRISASDWMPDGWTLDESVSLCQELEKLGCDFMDVSSGGLVANARIELKPGYQVPFATRIKQETGIPVMAVGLITDAEQAEQIISSEQADMVSLARSFLYNPRWPWHAAEKLGYPITYPNQYQRCKPAGENR
jgi:2,4-dienoyl-CoA reductase-like NADH-dependent reductase (Old Yellow Enzyme family)